MPERIEGDYLSDLILAEVLPAWSRDVVTITAQEGDLAVGTVLSIQSGAYAPVVAAGTGACAVLLDPLPAGGTSAVALTHGAVVNVAKLVLNGSSTDAQKKTTLSNLVAAGIVPRAVL
jgi:hypothetical protein